ncbi:hypothetical protein GCM10010191_03350 [Actinomadura vinacea]|uniref:DUF4440 domain-containing protein n=1 Tax=Actinomadura vinacea TaxID=115336 RepID=A0ABN3IBC0_9ACTN
MTPSNPQKDETEIRRIFQEELPAYVRASDITGYMSLWDEDCMWCPPDLPERRGKDEIRKGVSDFLAEYEIDPTFHAEEIKVVEQYGYVCGTSYEEVRPREGGPSKTVRSREIWLLRRADGDWKIARIIFNHQPAG